MAQHFAECFVNLRRGALASQTLAKLSFDHAESRFDVASLVIVGQEFGAFEVIEVKHP